ncbi:hypothetical protein LEN26_006865 [Aphanomyces euteiches]|nr:hypothetical protein AeMF1_013809 [Aphanomyces euteiches]KAH9134146.1 hypothetical protein LEN26_006865 [Aphanomyces euteiches]
MDTVISVHMHGSTGKRLVETLELVDKFISLKVTKLVKACEDRIYCDPCFGPNEQDPNGALALCKNGDVIPSKGGSQHQLKILKMLKDDKLKWQRPKYASETKSVLEETNNDEEYPETNDEPLFCEEGELFTKSASSGDVIQGRLGDCWFLGAISVLATRMELLIQAFWREDQYKQHGIFICRFMKDFSWHYVIIDDRIPVFEYNNNRAGKPFFARCSDPNELWVPLLEKAYAKLHGSYEALIGGYIDVALSDLTGLCSEQIVLKAGHSGFGDDPFAPKQREEPGDAFWRRLLDYKRNGTLMGCSIQPDPKIAKNVATEGSAGQGLYYKHAYGLIDVGEIKLENNKIQRLVKLRNPWGLGEWDGPWSDQSDEREKYDSEIQRVFKTMSRNSGANVFTSLQRQRKLRLVMEPQVEVTEVNNNDGTFFMTYDDWRTRYTHFFAGIDFADEWSGQRIDGKWDEVSNGGNVSKTTWINNPRYKLQIQQRCHLYISVSQHDPRGTSDAHLFPIGFHICTLQERNNAYEVKEPPKKSPAYYRLYPPNVQPGLCNGTVLESSPPAIIPGTVIPGVDEDGVPQPAYTSKQAATVDMVIEPGMYCIIPSMYMRTNKDTGEMNHGRFWISVYGDKPAFQLEGSEPIIEEEEISTPTSTNVPETKSPSVAATPLPTKAIHIPDEAVRRQFENTKDEMLAQARLKGIEYRDVKREFANAGVIRKADFKRRMMNLGFKMDEMSDEKVLILFNGMDKDKSNTIQAEELLEYFMLDMEEDRLMSAVPEREDEDVPEKVHQEGTLEVHLIGAKDLKSVKVKEHTMPMLTLPSVSYSPKETAMRASLAMEILQEKSNLAQELHSAFLQALNPTNAVFHKRVQELQATRKSKPRVNPRGPKKKLIQHDTTPVQHFFETAQERLDAAKAADIAEVNALQNEAPAPMPRRSFNWSSNTDSEASNGPIAFVRKPTVDPKLLHSSPYMQSLETRRMEMLQRVQQRKTQVLGDKQKQADLPRLIGGRKSGRNAVHCCDCHKIVIVNGKQNKDRTCMAQGCVNIFCDDCFERMTANDKYCDDCYLHEHGNFEVLGMQLRSMLLSKLAATDIQLDVLNRIFESLDENHSGDLSRDEFIHFLDKLKLHPPLTDNQIDGVFEELDIDNSGTLSFEEFKAWLLGRDSVWVPPDEDEAVYINTSKLSYELITLDSVNPNLRSFLKSIVDEMIDEATTKPMNSSWHLNGKPLEKRQLDLRFRQEHVLFQRICPIELIDNAGDEARGIAKLFSRFDVHSDGSIEYEEPSNLVQSIGLSASPVDLRIFSHLLQRTPGQGIRLTDLTMFIQRASSAYDRVLLDKLIELEQLYKEHQVENNDVKLILNNFYLGMPAHEMIYMAKQLKMKLGWSVDLVTLQRIALICTPCMFGDGKEQPASAGGVLLAMFHSSTGLTGTFSNYSIHDVSNAILALFKIEKPDQDDDIEWEKLGQPNLEEIAQPDLIECLLRRGLKLSEESLAMENQMRVAFALDALRYRDSVDHVQFSSAVSRSLFASLSRFTRVQALEVKMRHILTKLARLGSGQQFYQTLITRTPEATAALNVYVIDPYAQQALSYSFAAADISQSHSPLLTRKIDSSTGEVNLIERGTVNEMWYPELNNYFLGLLRRFRIKFTEDKAASLVFLESNALVAKLRLVFSSSQLPFFWSISPALIEFSVDQQTLEQSKLRLQPWVIQSLLRFPQIASFLRQINSTLSVHFEVISKPNSVHMSWREFKACLAGLQNAYAFVQLLPQGDSFRTPTDEGGGCTPQWNHSTSIRVKEPKECCRRADRPVVYVDTQPILGKPDSTGENLIPFTVVSNPESKKTSRGNASPPKFHFVVISVRKTVPRTNVKSTLYCTAYDPSTASDYEVVGTPEDWSLDYFDPDKNKTFATDWAKLLTQLRLGRTITPKLLIRVYNKQPKSDQLIGETEVSVSSMIAREGFGIKSWLPMYDPVYEVCTGQIEIQAHFQIRTNGQLLKESLQQTKSQVNLRKIPSKVVLEDKSNPNITTMPKAIIQSSASSNKAEEELKMRIQELEKELSKQRSTLSTSESADATKWKKKYEQLKKQTAEEQAQRATRAQDVQREAPKVEMETPSKASTLDDFSASATLASLRSILMSRCPAKPFNGLKKAMAAVADPPGKISVVACEEVLDDFGLALNASQKRNLFRFLDPDTSCIISIEDFLVKLRGDLNRATSKGRLEKSTPQNSPRQTSPSQSQGTEVGNNDDSTPRKETKTKDSEKMETIDRASSNNRLDKESSEESEAPIVQSSRSVTQNKESRGPSKKAAASQDSSPEKDDLGASSRAIPEANNSPERNHVKQESRRNRATSMAKAATNDKTQVNPDANKESASIQKQPDSEKRAVTSSKKPEDAEHTQYQQLEPAEQSSNTSAEVNFASDADLHKYLVHRLPENWDMKITPKGKPYFRNLVTRTTQWNHPVPDADRAYWSFVKQNKAKLHQ